MKATIEVPDAWISEDSDLYLVHQHPVGMRVLAERANCVLAEWDYPHRFDASTLLAARERLWVDPAFIMSEQWPKSAVSREPREGWVRVLHVDLDADAVPGPKDSTDPCPEWHCPDLSSEERREGLTCPEHPCTCSSGSEPGVSE